MKCFEHFFEPSPNELAAFKLVAKFVQESNLKGIGIFMIKVTVITLNKFGKWARGLLRTRISSLFAEYDYDRVLNHAQLTTLNGRRDHICVDLIKRMSNPHHKLHNLLPEKIGQVTEREMRSNGYKYYNFKTKTERFWRSPIAYAIDEYNRRLSP